MPKRDRHDLAQTLVRRSREDLDVIRELADNPRVADSIVGFHAQQAVEKAVTAVLVSRDVAFERTHDLDRLAELVQASGTALPVDADSLSALTDFAVVRRHDEPLEDEPVDRHATRELAEAIVHWAESCLRS